MSLSFIFEKNLKAQIVSVLINGNNRTARQLFYDIKKKGLSITLRGVYKALNELLKQKVVIKYSTDYEINPKWVSGLGNDANKALKKLLEKNLISVEEMQHPCNCGKGHTEGFCSLCYELICSHCGKKEFQHNQCGIKCLNCTCGHSQGVCVICGEKVCLACGKEIWSHEHQFCKPQNAEMNIAILEVDHDCWYSNLSEKYSEEIMLNNFSDREDKKVETHSGILKIKTQNQRKVVEKILKQGSIKIAKLIHKKDDIYYLRTRAKINKSVDLLTKVNKSVLLNPVLAEDSKEQNLIISSSAKEMKALSKGLEEFGGKVKLICQEKFNINDIGKIKNKKINKFLALVPKTELLDAIQSVRLMGEV
ncbi:MAG: hypothetical protein ABIF40_03680 [archaeon]